MADKPIVLSKHAEDMVDERKIPPQWIERVLRNPVLEEPDPRHPGAVRAYAPIAEFGNACFGSSIMILERKFG